MKVKTCVVCGKSFSPLHNSSRKTCYNPVCTKAYSSDYHKEYRQRNQSPSFREKLRKTELLAENWLIDKGLNPVRVTSSTPGCSVGVPDFKCDNNLWAEVKYCGHSDVASIQLNQWRYFAKLIKDNGQVLLLIYDKNYTLTVFEINLSTYSNI